MKLKNPKALWRLLPIAMLFAWMLWRSPDPQTPAWFLRIILYCATGALIIYNLLKAYGLGQKKNPQ